MDPTATHQNLTTFLVSFLGTGSAVALLNWFREARKERVSRRIEHLTSQLSMLYGPLLFLVSQNECITRQNAVNREAFNEKYIKPNWSEDKHTQESIDREVKRVLDTINHYSNLTIENNQKMVALIESHYNLAEPDDYAAFQELVLAWLRYRVEIQDGQPPIPCRFAREIGLIRLYDLDFVEQIQNRCADKTAELQRYRETTAWRSWLSNRKRKALPPAPTPETKQPVPIANTGSNQNALPSNL